MVDKAPPRPGDVSPANLGPWLSLSDLSGTGYCVARGLTYQLESPESPGSGLRVIRDGLPIGTLEAGQRAVAIDGADGYGLALRSGRRGPEVAAHYPGGHTDLTHAPALAWARETGDRWLTEEVGRRDTEEPYVRATAIGCLIRHQRPAPETASRRLMAMLDGRDLPDTAAAARWSQRLNPQTTAQLSELTTSEIEAISELVDWIAETVDPDNNEWCHSAGDLLRRRDALQDALAVLAAKPTASPQQIDDAVAALDEKGRRWTASAPVFTPGGDLEVLSRARADEAGAWWCQSR
jgi:hypothetical protein